MQIEYIRISFIRMYVILFYFWKGYFCKRGVRNSRTILKSCIPISKDSNGISTIFNRLHFGEISWNLYTFFLIMRRILVLLLFAENIRVMHMCILLSQLKKVSFGQRNAVRKSIRFYTLKKKVIVIIKDIKTNKYKRSYFNIHKFT